MAGRKKLGMGLDLLLTSVQSSVNQAGWDVAWNRIRNVFNQARREDERGHVFEAYYLYRLASDLVHETRSQTAPEARNLASQALNNAAVILYEHGYVPEARRLLEKAVQVCPDNQTARDNLNSLTQGG